LNIGHAESIVKKGVNCKLNFQIVPILSFA
jgi:hypothetical protein